MTRKLSVLLLVLLNLKLTYSATIHVPADQPTIQAGINAAVDGDTVLIADGTYTGDGNRDMDFLGKAIVVMSENGPDVCIIDCQGDPGSPHRAFVFHSAEDTLSQLVGVTIANGGGQRDSALYAWRGGAILCSLNTMPLILDCRFKSNTAMDGGAIAVLRGSAIIRGCAFDSNTASISGGALFCEDAATVIATECGFATNRAHSNCHTIRFTGDSLFLTRCTITGSHTPTGETSFVVGAFSEGVAPFVSIDECVIRDCVARSSILFLEGKSTIIQSRCWDNFGIMPDVGEMPKTFRFDNNTTVSNCIFAGNRSTYLGDNAVLSLGAFSSVQSTTIVGNETFHSSESGSATPAVEFRGAGGVIENSIIAFNTNVRGVAGEVPQVSCSDVFGNDSGDWVGAIAGQLGINGNISADPLLCDSAMADYSLQYSSPCRPENTLCGLMGALPVGCDGGALNALWVMGEIQDHVVSGAPELSWSRGKASPQAQFEIEVGSDSDWAVAEMWHPGAIITTDSVVTYSGLALDDGATYHSRVRIGDSAFWSDWIQASFRMNSVPTVPLQISPTEDMEVATALPTMVGVVSADAESDPQQLQFAIFMDDSLLVEESPLVPATFVPAGDTVNWTSTVPLVENGSYIWAVRAFDGYEHTNYWDAWRVFFVNAIQEAPSSADPVAPRSDSIVYGLHPAFAWEASTDPDPLDSVLYEHRVAIDSLFAFTQETDSLADTTHAQAAPLETGRRYWWKVISRDNHGLSAESAVETFRTYKPGDVNGSWTVTSADIITLVNYVFKSQPLTVPVCAGKVSGDGQVNASDIIWLVNSVFKGGPEPQAGCA